MSSSRTCYTARSYIDGMFTSYSFKSHCTALDWRASMYIVDPSHVWHIFRTTHTNYIKGTYA